jgi:hypothetical protein
MMMGPWVPTRLRRGDLDRVCRLDGCWIMIVRPGDRERERLCLLRGC